MSEANSQADRNDVSYAEHCANCIEIDLNIVMADMEKAMEQREVFPNNF